MKTLLKKEVRLSEEKMPAMGLTQREAEKRLGIDGENLLVEGKKISAIKIFLSQFQDMLVAILLISTVLSILMGEVVEAITIILIVLLNAVMGFIQEYRTEKTLDALKKMAAPKCKVLRDGVEVIIPAKEVVVGDAVVLEAGDKVPADGCLVEAVMVNVDESILTGESVGVDKTASQLSDVSHDFVPQSAVYMGTIVTKGRGTMIVTQTGMNSEMGKIADMLDSIEDEPTPLQKRLDELSKFIAIACVVICVIVAIAGILRGENVFDMIVTGISLAVAAVPEGLAAVVTISLALAISRMLKRNSLVRKLDAVETLGCASVICSDKTGTLTENKMTVTKMATLDDIFSVTGTGFSKDGGFFLDKREISPIDYKPLRDMLEISVLCSNAKLYSDEEIEHASISAEADSYCVSGEPTEIALAIAAAKGGFSFQNVNIRYKKINEIPFDSSRKCMTVITKTNRTDYRVMTKGALDVILKKCNHALIGGKQVLLDTRLRSEIALCNEDMAKTGLRVLGFCYKDSSVIPVDDIEQDMVYVGMIGIIDPPRKEVYGAIKACRRAGIRPVMITGDHKITAEAIAKEIKLYCPGDMVMTGEEIDEYGDREFERIISKVSVFARVNPSHKLRIVKALKNTGNIVAMTGDGVNDAPAVKEADIGAAMGINGTDVTKEAASIILLDDNFATLVATIEEGRIIYKNIRKFIRYLLSCNIGEVLTMFLGMLMGLPVVLQPIQILLVNLVTDGLPAIALGLEGGDGTEMSMKPRGKDESVFSKGLLSTIVFRGCLIGLCTLGAYVGLYRFSGSYETAQTGALLTLVLSQLVHVFECKSETKTLFQINVLDNLNVLLAVLISFVIAIACVYVPVLQGVFETVALGYKEFIIVLGYTIVGPIIGSIVSGINFRAKDR